MMMLRSLQDSVIIALPKTKGNHRVGSYLSRVFENSNILISDVSPRRDDVLYSYGVSDQFVGIQSGSTESANNLLDGVVNAGILGLNRLVDTALERGDAVNSDISYIPLNITETRCKVAFACVTKDMDNKGFANVVSSHPSIAKSYFDRESMDVGKVILRESSAETQARRLFGHCPVVDVTQTGNSFAANGYTCVKTIMESEAVLAWRTEDVEKAVKITGLVQQLGLDLRKKQPLSSLPIFRRVR